MLLRWDIFCRVIDNFGDIGVCWRLACDLGVRGHAVTLWVDDDSALSWMAPQGHPGVQVRPWSQAQTPRLVGATPGDVVIEAFACDPPPGFLQAMALTTRPPVWINLEYLSAERWVERCHRLPSPRWVEPGAGMVKWFFHPGFQESTGGLLREAGLMDQRSAFERAPWMQHKLGLRLKPHERLVVVFCYPQAPMGGLIAALVNAAEKRPTLLVIAGALPQASHGLPASWAGTQHDQSIRIVHAPLLSQTDFDRLLWSADVNFVRGEDSAVRAIWAGAPMVWQLYPQQDQAHHTKALAFLQTFHAKAGVDEALASSMTAWWSFWNGMDEASSGTPNWPDLVTLEAWAAASARFREALLRQPDLTSSLTAFAEDRLTHAPPGRKA